METRVIDFVSINRAFSKQSIYYDHHDFENQILINWRKRVYIHLERFLRPQSRILELNAGTGIDALHFAKIGHQVHATDLSDGMIHQIKEKISSHNMEKNLTCQQCSYDRLNEINQKKFDYIFSNFGGLNCIDDLSKVTDHFSKLLKPRGYVTLVIMPPICPWEWLWLLKGHWKSAARRLQKNGTIAHLEGENFMTYYFSLKDVKKAFGKNFKFIKAESLGLISPPPSKEKFPEDHKITYSFLSQFEKLVGSLPPFNRWGDHIIVTFQLLT